MSLYPLFMPTLTRICLTHAEGARVAWVCCPYNTRSGRAMKPSPPSAAPPKQPARLSLKRLAWLLVCGCLCLLLGLWLASTQPQGVARSMRLLQGNGWQVPATHLQPTTSTATKTALLTHGVLSSREFMLHLGESLAQIGYECLVIDFRGHGASAEPFVWEALGDDIELAARALAGEGNLGKPRIDLFLGHSMGAYAGQRAAKQGRFEAQVFASLGANVVPDSLAAARVLLLTGAQDLLAQPARQQELAAASQVPVEVVVVEACEHAFEPHHSALVEALLQHLGYTGAYPATGVWWLRQLGSLLVLAGALLLLWAGLPRLHAGGSEAALLSDGAASARPNEREHRAGKGLGFLVGGLAAVWLLACLAAGTHGVWLNLLPTERSLLPLAAFVVAFSALCACLAWLVGRIVRTQRRVLAGQLLLLAGTCLASLVFWAGGQKFFAFIALLAVPWLVLSFAFSQWVARRTGQETAALGSSGIMLGFFPGLWAPVFAGLWF